MRDSHQIVVIAAILFFIGLGLALGGMSIQIPSAYKTFLGIPYDVNPAFESSLYEMLILLGLGIFLISFGVGLFSSIGYIVRLEKKLSRIPPPPQAFCRFCGSENKLDAVFCSKCGKKLT